jgi:hypothetical protein
MEIPGGCTGELSYVMGHVYVCQWEMFNGWCEEDDIKVKKKSGGGGSAVHCRKETTYLA